MRDRIALAERLLALPGLICAAERAVIAAELRAGGARVALVAAEDALLTGDRPPDGKNAETRAAQLRASTPHLRALLALSDGELLQAKAAHHQTLHEFSALRSVARLLTDND